MRSKNSYIVKCLDLETGETTTVGFPWSTYTAATGFASHAQRLGREKKLYRVDGYTPTWTPPPPPARPILADNDTYLLMDI